MDKSVINVFKNSLSQLFSHEIAPKNSFLEKYMYTEICLVVYGS